MKTTMNRRKFLKRTGATLAWLALPRVPVAVPVPDEPDERPILEVPPASLGRIATWWRQAVRSEPSPEAEWVAWKTRDEIIPLHAAITGTAPWSRNPIWYQTEGGFIHSGYVQLVENAPSSEIVIEEEPGFWARVCVPIAEARLQPNSSHVRYKLYYGTIYRVIGTVADDEDHWWYQLKEGITYAPGPYVPAWSMCRIPPEEMAPISPGRSDKWIQISLETQRLTCFEGEKAVFSTRISSGAAGTATPRGEHRVLYKRHTKRMIGGNGADYYDLLGVAFPTYFTRSAVAVHGTYWHNDFVRPHSHGCVNASNQAAQWVFRWTDPVVSYDDYERKAEPEQGTRIVVV
jgi:hypothetical protein